MSEPKETEPRDDEGDEAESEAQSEAEGSEAESEAEGSEAEPKKKKKKARESSEPETIRDRNERVRAEAAEKRRARRAREQAAAAPRRNLDASELMDDALARSTHAAWGFLRKHFNKVQWAIMAGLCGWIAWEVYSWRHTHQAEKATAELFKALSAETGKVSGGEAPPEAERGMSDTRRSFASDEERLKAAQKEYVLAAAVAGPQSAVLVNMGAAGVAYDLGQYKQAQAAFEKVRKHPAFASDGDIKGRTLEGLGMALEAQKDEAGALKAFKELANSDTANFAALGCYHQARILKAQGKNEDALKLLDKAGEKLILLKDTPSAIKYLRVSISELYESLNPLKARELQQKLLPADILKQLQDKMPPEARSRLSGGAPPAPLPMPVPIDEAPAPAPETPAPEAPAPGPLRDVPVAPQDAPAPAPSGAP